MKVIATINFKGRGRQNYNNLVIGLSHLTKRWHKGVVMRLRCSNEPHYSIND